MTKPEYEKKREALMSRRSALGILHRRPDMKENRRSVEIAAEGVAHELIQLEREWDYYRSLPARAGAAKATKRKLHAA